MAFDPFIKNATHEGYPVFAGFHGLAEEGIPKYIQDSYEDAVSRASWFSYNGMWKAAGKGIIKGIIGTAIAALVIGAVVGIVGDAAGYGAWSETKNIIKGIGETYKIMTGAGALNYAIPIATIGSMFGAVYEVGQHRDAVQADLIKTREAMRELIGVERDKHIGIEQAHVVHEFDPMGEVRDHGGVDEWKDRVAARQETGSWVARENARQEQANQDIQRG